MIVILTGAGISKESGLDTFRDASGLWQQVSMDDVATPGGYIRNPHMVHEFHNALRRGLLDERVQPNAAHRALARLERESPEEVLVVTQNIDNLHERAGSRNVLHMHGELLKARCNACGAVIPWEHDLWEDTPCPACGKTSLRPHVVWFGEIPLFMDTIEDALRRCSHFVSIGTSGSVYPAAGFSYEARQHGARVIELNMERTAGKELFHEGFYGPASKVVPRWVDAFLRVEPSAAK